MIERKKNKMDRKVFRSLTPAVIAPVLVSALLTGGCASPPARLVRGAVSPDVEARRESVVRLRAYSSGSARSREHTRDLLIGALDDTDAEVRRLAALGLIAYARDDEVRREVRAALARCRTPAERARLTDVLSRFR